MLPQRLLVPLFQRPYVWNEELQWEPLWRDVERVSNRLLYTPADAIPHFIGAVVLQARTTNVGDLPEFAVIDGQQRLTTLQILLDALHAQCVEVSATAPAERLHELVENKSAYCKHPEDRYKVWPTNRDRPAFNEVMSAPTPVEYDGLDHAQARLVHAHKFFFERSREYILAEGEQRALDRANALERTARELLQMVVIELSVDENAQEIFETLNARGSLLTAADLIKNFIFQRLLEEGVDVDKAYNDYWKEFETPFWEEEVSMGRLIYSRASVFLGHWLMAKTGEEIVAREVFTRFKTYALHDCGLSMTDLLRQVHTASHVYREFIEAGKTKLPSMTRRDLFCYRTTVMESDMIRVLLLWLYDPELQRVDPISNERLDRCLQVIETWFVRRMLVRATTKLITRTLVELVARLNVAGRTNADEVIEQYFSSLQADANYLPDDDYVSRELRTGSTYRRMHKGRLRMVMEAIEDHLNGYKTGGKPLAANRITKYALTIEHIMPQKWETSWAAPEDNDVETRNVRVHQLGNLVLTTQSLNSAVSNGPWEGANGKRVALQRHGFLASTADLLRDDQTSWTDADIDKRTQRMIDAILEIWPVPPGYRTQLANEADERARAVDLRDLINAGLLKAGQRLYAIRSKYMDVEAFLTSDGRIAIGNELHDTPSGAGFALRMRSTNGWVFWTTDEQRKKSLRLYRSIYLQQSGLEQSGDFDIDEAIDELTASDRSNSGTQSDFWYDYWAELKNYFEDCDSPINLRTPLRQNWKDVGIGRSGCWLSMQVWSRNSSLEDSGPGMNVALIVNRPQWFEQLQNHQSEIESKFGSPLDWNVKEGRKQRFITTRTNLDPTNKSNWPECFEWHLENLTKLRTVLQPFVQELV
jgi:hypothetical protein